MVWLRSSRLALFACAALVALAGRRAAAETVLVDFTQDSCPPCVEMEPVLRQLEAGGLAIQRVDVRRDPRTAQQFRVTVTPTYVVLVDGREWARVTGLTQLRVMQEMVVKAEQLARNDKARSPVAAVGFDHAAAAGESSAPVMTLENGPQDGRVVPIRDPFASMPRPNTSANSPGAGALDAPGAEHATAASGVDPARLIEATVRLSITDPTGKSTGTGSIVDARNGMALVLTCGHLFRESNGQGAIEISLFTAGPNGAEVRGTVEGELFHCDLERDLALVRFRTESPVTVTPIAPPGTLLLPNATVTSVGCNHGDNPTAWSSTIKTVDRYTGHPNVEAAGAPVEGRSGGGLFNAQGQLIGVCYAADPQGNEGLYASFHSVHQKLDELQLQMVYESPSTSGPRVTPAAQPATQLAAAETPEPAAIRGQEPTPAPSSALANAAGASSAATSAAALAGSLTAEEQATLEEIARRSGGGEVICIIQPRSPDGRSDVIKLSGVSPAFVKALAASATQAQVQVSAPAGAATALAPGPMRR
jgi:thiol-disulfide isomerase/thioredoxin